MWSLKTVSFMAPKRFGVDLNLHIGMHASCEVRFAIRRRSKVQLVSSIDSAIM
jgi:hypothetical protein